MDQISQQVRIWTRDCSDRAGGIGAWHRWRRIQARADGTGQAFGGFALHGPVWERRSIAGFVPEEVSWCEVAAIDVAGAADVAGIGMRRVPGFGFLVRLPGPRGFCCGCGFYIRTRHCRACCGSALRTEHEADV
jgi:hypothetical protein